MWKQEFIKNCWCWWSPLSFFEQHYHNRVLLLYSKRELFFFSFRGQNYRLKFFDDFNSADTWELHAKEGVLESMIFEKTDSFWCTSFHYFNNFSFYIIFTFLHMESAPKKTVIYIYSKTLENTVTPPAVLPWLLGQTVIWKSRNFSFSFSSSGESNFHKLDWR